MALPTDPTPITLPPFTLTQAQWERFSHSSSRFNDDDPGRYESIEGELEDQPSDDWKYAYWCGSEFLNAMFCHAWLVARGEQAEIWWDLATGPQWDGGYVVLTNWVSPGWAGIEARDSLPKASTLPPLNVPTVACFFASMSRFGPCDGPPSFLVQYFSVSNKDQVIDQHRSCNKHGLDEIDRHHAANGTAPIHMTEVS